MMKEIIKGIDEFIDTNELTEVSPTEVSEYLDRKGLLRDSPTRKGKPLRDLLRKKRIPHAFQYGNKWRIPHSKGSEIASGIQTIQRNSISKPCKKVYDKHKIEPIARLVAECFQIPLDSIEFEYKPQWLGSWPTKDFFGSKWELIEEVYQELVDGQYNINDRIYTAQQTMSNRRQSFDMWCNEMGGFGIEFDESQHFNQYRQKTLKFYDSIEVGFNISKYLEFTNRIIPPGTSGFTRLKSNDPLFPEMLNGRKQDNRIRQRAFKDFLKDIGPLSLGHLPTVRIPYHLTEKRIKDFNESDMRRVRTYLSEIFKKKSCYNSKLH